LQLPLTSDAVLVGPYMRRDGLSLGRAQKLTTVKFGASLETRDHIRAALAAAARLGMPQLSMAGFAREAIRLVSDALVRQAAQR
jgi:hypothetical protein